VKPPTEVNDVVLEAINREQERIGNRLHENVCQTLAGVSIQAGLLANQAQRGRSIKAPQIQQLAHNLQGAIDEVRAISRELRGRNLVENGFIEALANLAEVTQREMPCEFLCEKPVFIKDCNIALALFRIAEEGVRNAIRHGAPKKIVISLTRSGTAVTLAIRDDGTGFTPPFNDKTVRGIGLMYRRARAAGAELNITSKRGSGTTVSCTWISPLPPRTTRQARNQTALRRKLTSSRR
jgi:signal transduction histidine kinase